MTKGILLVCLSITCWIWNPSVAHVKSILGHDVHPPESLTAQYYEQHKHDGDVTPTCAGNASHPNGATKFCLHDHEYPISQIEHAIKYHYHAVASIYKDVILNTDLSVDHLATLEQEHFLCPSHVEYTRPLRAINTHGKWSIIVNNIPASYDHLTQTVRIEKCKFEHYPCPLLPACYESKCVQKYTYHRFLVYNPKDYYYPFRVETFKLPSSCDCIASEYNYHDHLNSKNPYTGSKTVKQYHAPEPVQIIQDYVKKEIISPIYYPKTDQSSSNFNKNGPPHYVDKTLG
ncbi:hypothetical protein TCAL_08984 [Tigriopus californicus]|uniref:Spaetzle domain-containing protein n=1 Tax=Tigriopus californicus TaxID=6832 RepID=A0A553PL55_TIGCA|nr:neurotrophin 1-like [Tigriopus californicus]TRY78392.1 hypothetical protein TCAL_08984 [Tigriopus californicus]